VRKRLSAVVLVLLVVAALGVTGCGSKAGTSDAVATIGQVGITQAQFDTRLAEFETQYAGQVPDKTTDPTGYLDFQQSVLEYMVRLEVVKQKAASLKIAVTDYDVQTQVGDILTQTFAGDQTAFDAALKEQNLTMAQLQASLKEQLLMQKAYEAATIDLTTVPEAEVQTFYDANKADYYTDETRTARHILISATPPVTTTDPSATTTTTTPTEADWTAAKAKADQVRAEIVAGLGFAEAAAKYSTDPGTKDAGGDLGTVAKGEMVAAFDEAVFSLPVNEMSQPIKTEYGYHIIEVTAIIPAKQLTLDEVKAEITSTLVSDAQAKAWQDWMTAAKAELKVTYKEGMELTTTTTGAPADASTTPTTAGGASSTTGSTNTPATTAAPATTTTAAAPESTTTSQ
jgi:foldase protein PrsA